MNDKERLLVLENVLAQMLRPVRGVPFSVIIRSLADKDVLKFDARDENDAALLTKLKAAIGFAASEVADNPIRRPRPNEVGNDIEAFVLRGLKKAELTAMRPTSVDGRAKSTGYPDILVFDDAGRPTYVECKIFAHAGALTTMRSFYLSPSESFKVAHSARHLLLAFGMSAEAISGSRDSLYSPCSYKLIDLHDLSCDVKYEFNSDNRRLYAPGLVLLEGLLKEV